MSPSWSKKGSRRYKVLDFLISDFIAFANWRSLSQSTRLTFCRASLSLGNALLCTSLRMVFSALSSSSTLKGLRLMLSARCTLSAPPLGSNALSSVFGFRRSIQAMDFFIRCHSEKRVSLFKRSTFSATSILWTRTFLTSGSLYETSSMSLGSWGHSHSGNHRKVGPVIQRCCLDSSWPFIPRDETSAGLISVPTYLHWSGLVASLIVCTRLATNTWKRFLSFRMYFKTVVLSVQ